MVWYGMAWRQTRSTRRPGHVLIIKTLPGSAMSPRSSFDQTEFDLAGESCQIKFYKIKRRPEREGSLRSSFDDQYVTCGSNPRGVDLTYIHKTYIHKTYIHKTYIHETCIHKTYIHKTYIHKTYIH